jgi:hypothetical protein
MKLSAECFRAKSSFQIFAVFVGLWITSVPAAAQDVHYWTEQYGARSMLLSGSVIGSVNDMSAVYYNPGALGYIENPELVLSANAYQIRSINVRDGAGKGFDLESSGFNPIPNLLAGTFRFNFYGPNKLAYSALSRHSFEATLQGSRSAVKDIDPDLPGDEIFAGGLMRHVRVSDVWLGLTWARELSSHIGIGVSTFLSVRNEESQDQFIAQAQAQSGEALMLLSIDDFNARTYSLLWKGGLGFDFRPLTFGITVTTPNVRVAGSGSATLNKTAIGVDIDGDGIPDNGFSTDIQNDIKSHYRSPLSIGAGGAWHIRRAKLHFSAEWFNSVDCYQMLELSPLISQTGGETVNRSLQHCLESVINFGLGYEQTFGKTYSGFLGFNTDHAAYDPESEVATTSYDIYHVSGGGKVTLEKASFTFGIRYAWGSEVAQQPIDLDPNSEQDVLGNRGDVTLEFRQLTFLVGFDLNI